MEEGLILIWFDGLADDQAGLVGGRHTFQSKIAGENLDVKDHPSQAFRRVWIAVTTYLMVAIIHKQMKLPGILHRTLQLLSVHPFEKLTLNELPTEPEPRTLNDTDCNQLKLFEL